MRRSITKQTQPSRYARQVLSPEPESYYGLTALGTYAAGGIAAHTHDHGALTGLGDDDHTQYLLADGSRYLGGDLLPDGSGNRSIGSSTRELAAVWLDGDPTYNHEAATKGYVDRAVTSLGAVYFAYDDDSGISDYKLCELIPSSGGTQSVSKASLSDGDYIQGWISTADNTPPILLAGVYDFTIYAEKTAGTKTLQIYWELYERKSDDSEVLIATSADSDEVGGSITKFAPPIVLTDDYYPDAGSRIVGKIRARVSGSGNAPSITLYYEGDYDSRWEIPASSEVLRYLFVPYENAVSDVDLGAYGLTAQDITVTGLTQGSVPFIGSGGLLSEDNDNLYWDNTNKRLGIGTDSPATGLHIYGTGRREARVETTGATSDAILSLGTDNASRAAYLIAYGSSHASAANDFAMKNAYGDIAWFTDTGGSPSERMRLSGYALTLGTYSATDVTIWLQTQAGSYDSFLKHRESDANYGFTVGYDGGLNQYIWRRHNNSEAGSIVMSLYRDKDLLNLTPGTDAPSAEGDLGMDSALPSLRYYIGGDEHRVTASLYELSAPVQQSGAGGYDDDVVSYTIPHELRKAGSKFRVVARGTAYIAENNNGMAGITIYLNLEKSDGTVVVTFWSGSTNIDQGFGGSAKWIDWQMEGEFVAESTTEIHPNGNGHFTVSNSDPGWPSQKTSDWKRRTFEDADSITLDAATDYDLTVHAQFSATPGAGAYVEVTGFSVAVNNN